MPIETDEIVLKNDGSAVRRTYQECPCNVVDEIAKQMGENATRIVRRAGSIDKIPYAIVRSAKETYCVMKLPALVINTPWEIGEDKLMRPNFGDTSGENPTLPLKWPAPTGMTLLFAARIYHDSGYECSRPKDSCYLLALDKSLNCYMMPLPNLYETGYLCMGDFDGTAGTVHDAFELAYRQFVQSKWNSDLLTGTRTTNANLMMAFKPEGEQFIPVDYPAWATRLQRCEGVSIELLKGVLRP